MELVSVSNQMISFKQSHATIWARANVKTKTLRYRVKEVRQLYNSSKNQFDIGGWRNELSCPTLENLMLTDLYYFQK